jgi:hypothetical protein
MTSEPVTCGPAGRRGGVLAQCALFSLLMLAAYLTIASGAAICNAPDVWLVAAAAAGICWGTGIIALATSSALGGPDMALLSMLVGLFVRMFVPLVVCAIVYARGGVLAHAGLAYYVLIFYMVSLAIETRYLVTQLRKCAAPGNH